MGKGHVLAGTQVYDKIKCEIGTCVPLGLSRQGDIWNFAISVPNVQECRIILSVCDQALQNNHVEQVIFNLTEEYRIGSVFAIAIQGLQENCFTYHFEVDGKRLIDPYVQDICGREQFGTISDKPIEGRYLNQAFDWQGDRALEHDYSDFIIYKLHVRGFTMDSGARVKHPGTYRGILEKVTYLQTLGINALLLMPCYEFNESENDKINFWGYGADSFYFVPKISYASIPAESGKEFKEMVRELHKAGMEVLMEFSFPQDINPGMVTDILRFWVMEYHVDGFRLEPLTVPSLFLTTDPYLKRSKIIMESFNQGMVSERDGAEGYKHLAVMDTSFQSNVRKFLKGDEAVLLPFIEAMRKNPSPYACINTITDHNGFTLLDLFSYDLKHNEANEEGNRDGTDRNFSWNCGQEGNSRNRRIMSLRLQMIRNAMMALFLAQGAPMLLAGDEMLNSQDGNNNAYCQDNPIGWLNWSRRKEAKDQLEFVRKLIRLRKEHPIFHNPEELKNMDYASNGCPDISFHGIRAWQPDFSFYSRTIGILLNGSYAGSKRGKPDSSFYLIFNMHWEPHVFDLPVTGKKMKNWEPVVGSCMELLQIDNEQRSICVPARTSILLQAESMIGALL